MSAVYIPPYDPIRPLFRASTCPASTHTFGILHLFITVVIPALLSMEITKESTGKLLTAAEKNKLVMSLLGRLHIIQLQNDIQGAPFAMRAALTDNRE